MLLVVGGLGVGSFGAEEIRAERLVAQILDPVPHRKLREGEKLGVRIRVAGAGEESALSWSVSLQALSGAETMAVAAGTQFVRDAVVAELTADQLPAGRHNLILIATVTGATANADATFDVVRPTYTVIPSVEGNLSRLEYATYGSDGDGNLLFISGPLADPEEIVLLHRPTGRRESVFVDTFSNEGVVLSDDGLRLYYAGAFRAGDGSRASGLGFLDLSSGKHSLIAPDGNRRYSLDRTGRRVTYQGLAADRSQQYFLYDGTSGETRQLTNDPRAIVLSSDARFCPQRGATAPFISDDGATIVVVTSATLGVVPEDESVGCRVFSYDVEQQAWRHVASLPPSRVVHGPAALSADGRWLSFISSHRPPEETTAVVPAVLDVRSGELRDPLVDVGRFTSFDAVITRDARGMVISTQADLDPRVGNADHNMELFYYDLETATFSQITETIRGIGRASGGCSSYRPAVSNSGDMAAFLFIRFSVELCQLDGPQRNEADGFVFSFVRAVRKRSDNRGPVFERREDLRVAAGNTLTLNLTATDPDGDPISFFAQVKDGFDVPPGSEITDHHDGTATFTWPTRPENAGEWILRVAAFDEGGGEVFHDVTISVVGEGQPLPTPTPTFTATPASTSPSPVVLPCPGDCDRDEVVRVDELVMGTHIALGKASLENCPALACSGGAAVTIECLVQAVDSALRGCR